MLIQNEAQLQRQARFKKMKDVSNKPSTMSAYNETPYKDSKEKGY